MDVVGGGCEGARGKGNERRKAHSANVDIIGGGGGWALAAWPIAHTGSQCAAVGGLCVVGNPKSQPHVGTLIISDFQFRPSQLPPVGPVG